MFVARYARLPPGSRFHLSVNVQIFPCNALYRAFAVTIWVGSDRLLQCAIPPRYHFITARALYYNARYGLGTARALWSKLLLEGLLLGDKTLVFIHLEKAKD